MPARRRRDVLILTGTGLTAALAGCTGSSDDDDDDGADDTGNGGGDSGANGGDGSGGDDDNGDGDNGDEPDVPGQVIGAEDRVEVLDHEWYHGDDGAGVSGTLENVSGEELETVWAEVYFFPDEDVDFAKTEDMAADSTWEFDVAFPGSDPDEVTEYKIEPQVSN